MVLPLRLWTGEEPGQNDSPLLAHTVDISPVGARLGGLREPLRSGQIITLQRGKDRNRFRVVWTQQLDANEMRAGLETIEPGKKLWDVNLPEESATPKQSVNVSKSPAKSALANALATIVRATSRSASGSTAKRSLKVKVESIAAARFRQTAEKYLQNRWASAVAILIIVIAAGVLMQELNPRPVETASLQRPDLSQRATNAAPPHPSKLKDPVKVVFVAKAAANSGPDPLNRLRLDEAPQGHLIYPDAPQANLSGRVNLKVVIGMAGRVKEIWVMSGNRELAKAAIQAVKQWRYSQPELDGRAVEAETNVTIEFQGQDAVSIHFPTSTVVNTQS
jgi:TonB family protein